MYNRTQTIPPRFNPPVVNTNQPTFFPFLCSPHYTLTRMSQVSVVCARVFVCESLTICLCLYFWARALLFVHMCSYACSKCKMLRCHSLQHMHTHAHRATPFAEQHFGLFLLLSLLLLQLHSCLVHSNAVCARYFFVCESIPTQTAHHVCMCIALCVCVRVYMLYVCMFVSKLSIYNTVIRPHFV